MSGTKSIHSFLFSARRVLPWTNSWPYRFWTVQVQGQQWPSWGESVSSASASWGWSFYHYCSHSSLVCFFFSFFLGSHFPPKNFRPTRTICLHPPRNSRLPLGQLLAPLTVLLRTRHPPSVPHPLPWFSAPLAALSHIPNEALWDTRRWSRHPAAPSIAPRPPCYVWEVVTLESFGAETLESPRPPATSALL